MLKRILKLFIIFITLLYNSQIIYAYEYVNSNNESNVLEDIMQIFDIRDQYEELAGGQDDEIQIYNANNYSYWWPIGSRETTEINGKKFAAGNPISTLISADYGLYDPFGTGTLTNHYGVDIATGENNPVYIVAAKSGIVLKPTESEPTNCSSDMGDYGCGGGYGNYVLIQHSDGNYTVYAHMLPNTITVKAGESVEQGQVLGQMGSSGRSTGRHLHFELRIGQNDKYSTINPLEYISMENPRTVSSSNDLLKFVEKWEGHSPVDGSNYIVEDIGDGVRTVGAGVTLEYNSELFKKYGINIDEYKIGSKIPIQIVDQIELEILDNHKSIIENTLANNSINLKDYQIDALISMSYNLGNIDGFAQAYSEYGDTELLRDNWFLINVGKGTQFETGLTRRRNGEWALFHNGNYGL